VIPAPPPGRERVIGVFDSGFGGLTVLRALLPRLPGSHFVYLGDTARLPYGAKSQATVARYAVEAARFLVDRGAQLLVIACNTATALALPAIRAAVAVPVIGVVEPGANAAFAAAQRAASPGNGTDVLVLATAATVQSHAYRDTCSALGLRVQELPCPLLVPLVEEGWTDHPVTSEVLRIYLAEALAAGHPKAVLLGCTHYPLLAGAIANALQDLGCDARVVDSAEATGLAVSAALGHPNGTAPTATFECFATDSVEKFARLGSRFLGRPIPEVHLLDLGG
jgi:glutamate racemase